jgi:hypothetical protein
MSSSAAAGTPKPQAYPLGYVKDLVMPRTKLGAFFSILSTLFRWRFGQHDGADDGAQ